jgi:hypothetical protein
MYVYEFCKEAAAAGKELSQIKELFQSHPYIYTISSIQSKKPAIIATIAATPPFATKGVAGDEVEGDEAAELADEALVATEPLVDDPLGVAPMPDPLTDPLLVAIGGVGVTAADPEDDEPLPLAELVNETGLGVATGPVGVRLAVEVEKNQN